MPDEKRLILDSEWDRRIPWRQADVLTADAVASLRLVPNADPTSHVAVVVSHHCDLMQSPDSEPMVEVIVGRRDRPNGKFHAQQEPEAASHSAAEAGSPNWVKLLGARYRRSALPDEFDRPWSADEPPTLYLVVYSVFR